MYQNKIMEQVNEHHKYALKWCEQHNCDIIMTMLVGSQNYKLDNENSDVDTCSFVLPDIMTFIRGDKITAKEIVLEDESHVVIKDLRDAFNLLRKPSPNSIEWFLSQYRIFNVFYQDILEDYLNNNYSVYRLVHSNFKYMTDAVAGTIRGLHGRNMTNGKKYAHIIRLMDLINKYYDMKESPLKYLLVSEENLELAREAKNNKLSYVTKEFVEQISNAYTNAIALKAKQPLTEAQKHIEQDSQNWINIFQYDLFKRYLSMHTLTSFNGDKNE